MTDTRLRDFCLSSDFNSLLSMAIFTEAAEKNPKRALRILEIMKEGVASAPELFSKGYVKEIEIKIDTLEKAVKTFYGVKP